MHAPPTDPRDRTDYDRLTWRRVLVSYALMAAIPVLLWAASSPLAAGLVAAGSAGAVVTTRQARRLARCVRTCRRLAVDLPGTVRLTVDWGSRCDTC